MYTHRSSDPMCLAIVSQVSTWCPKLLKTCLPSKPGIDTLPKGYPRVP